jgi:transcriptional regulator with XRE-family HTH domain
MLGICQSTYANLEAGKTNLSVDRLHLITEILEIDVHRLLHFPKRTTKTASASNNDIASKQAGIDPKVLSVYDQLITEMRGEIAFLREMLRGQK